MEESGRLPSSLDDRIQDRFPHIVSHKETEACGSVQFGFIRRSLGGLEEANAQYKRQREACDKCRNRREPLRAAWECKSGTGPNQLL